MVARVGFALADPNQGYLQGRRATIKDYVGECNTEAKRRKSQGRGKPCPYHDTHGPAKPCHGRGAPALAFALLTTLAPTGKEFHPDGRRAFIFGRGHTLPAVR